MRALQAQGIGSDSYGKPPSKGLIISRAVDQPEWDLDVLLKAFDSEIEARERCEPIGTNPTDTSTPKKLLPGQTSKDKDISTGAALTNQTEKPAPVSCTFCKQGHPSTNCSTVTDINSRKSLLKQQGRCFVCLRRNHLARNCSPNKVCRICSGRHHMSICENANRDSGAPRNQPQGSSVVAPNREERRSSTTVYVDSNMSILLQTAIASVSTVQRPHPVVDMHVLFDSGSQRSYISEHARGKLNLLPKRKEKLLIKTFGCRGILCQGTE